MRTGLKQYGRHSD